MPNISDKYNRQVRFTDERLQHIKTCHPEMTEQLSRVEETLQEPDKVVRSRTDSEAELFYRFYSLTPVTRKYLCVVVKVLADDAFVITAYYTDTVKKGAILWEKT
jgi:hypothetical protein